jgi:hypothetical protein
MSDLDPTRPVDPATGPAENGPAETGPAETGAAPAPDLDATTVTPVTTTPALPGSDGRRPPSAETVPTYPGRAAARFGGRLGLRRAREAGGPADAEPCPAPLVGRPRSRS